MAKITITIEDIDGGLVTVNCDPKMEEMGNLFMSETGLTAAHSFAILALNAIRKDAIESDSIIKSEVKSEIKN